jgi:methyl-accepting chemotaxis protein
MTPDPTAPLVTISRAPHSGTIAEGGDELAFQLLKLAGFIRQTSPLSFWYRLPYDMGEAYENEHATRAATMLMAVGYRVALDPELGAPPTEPALVATQPAIPDPGPHLLALADGLAATPAPAQAAQFLDLALDYDTGALVRVQEVIQAGAEWARESEPEDGDSRHDALHDALDQASAALFTMVQELRSIPDDVRALARPMVSAAERARAALSQSPARTAQQTRQVAADPTADYGSPHTPRRQR